jgi:site-specific DNA-methyltransferase (adenine-specific)
MALVTLYRGDCRTLMAEMGADSIDAIVTDPPYGLEFMGKGWDHGVPGVPFWVEALRVAKPGAHLVAFGGTRTHHRLMCAIEDAGWEIRDTLMWLYGSGFPKSMDVAKALDKAAGVEREDKFEGSFERRAGPTGNKKCETCGKWLVSGSPCQCPRPQDEPVSEEAQRWRGWGTALKPAWEPIILARKPLVGTVAANVLRHGVGAINIDGTRITTTDNLNGGAYAGERRDKGTEWQNADRSEGKGSGFRQGIGEFQQPPGRFPANLVLDEEAGALLDQQSGVSKGTGGSTSGGTALGQGSGWNPHANRKTPIVRANDEGGASRFFYCPKASQRERNAGLEGRNPHATVKPVALMRWLVRLVTPPGGLVLDPFCGSGSTGVAAKEEGFRFIGMELSEVYIETAMARLGIGGAP